MVLTSLLGIQRSAMGVVPQNRRSRWLLTAAAIIVLYFLAAPSGQSQIKGLGQYAIHGEFKTSSKVHPIKLLHEEAMQRFQNLIDSQSKTLEEAITEYERRYQRAPPPGFDKWFGYAQFKRSPIIDDFDMILESLKPWEKIAPEVIKRVYERAASGYAVHTFEVKKGVITTDESDWHGVQMRELLRDIAQEIPDLQLLVNHLDEPRVVLTTRGDTEIIHWLDESKVSAWARTEGPCAYRREGEGPHLPAESKVETHGIPFVTDHWNSIDICKNPQFETQHGFLIAPFSMYVTNSPVPVISQAKPSTFADILMPSMWYYNHNIDNLESIDTKWEDKKNALYWAGSTTGGVMRDLPDDDGMPILSQRLRFVKATKQLGKHVYSFLTQNPKNGKWIKTVSDVIQSELYDTKFTGVVQCEGEHCSKAEAEYMVGERDPQDTAWKFKFLMDIDGNSFSGRFYNFLNSRSCPLKSTLFREWHDERLVPWVHYVPISVGLEDLPETMRYLATTDEGQKIARTIADMGREWHDKFLRKDDAALYLFRLFLEYGALLNPDRVD